MARFYTPQLERIDYVPKKDGKGTRRVWESDAIRNLWAASITTIAGTQSGWSGDNDWTKKQYVLAAEETAKATAWDKGTISLPDKTISLEDNDTWCDHVMALGDKRTSFARELGSSVHDAIEKYFTWRAGQSQAPAVDKSIKPYLYAIDEFAKKYSIKANPSDLAHKIVVREAPAGGNRDFLGQGFGLNHLVLDWKTQSVKTKYPKFKYNYCLQLAAYWAAGGKVGDIAIVILDTSKHEEYTRENLPKIHWKVFDKKETELYYEEFLQTAYLYYRSRDFDIDALRKAFA